MGADRVIHAFSVMVRRLSSTALIPLQDYRASSFWQAGDGLVTSLVQVAGRVASLSADGCVRLWEGRTRSLLWAAQGGPRAASLAGVDGLLWLAAADAPFSFFLLHPETQKVRKFAGPTSLLTVVADRARGAAAKGTGGQRPRAAAAGAAQGTALERQLGGASRGPCSPPFPLPLPLPLPPPPLLSSPRSSPLPSLTLLPALRPLLL